jgi:hypothetical protein
MKAMPEILTPEQQAHLMHPSIRNSQVDPLSPMISTAMVVQAEDGATPAEIRSRFLESLTKRLDLKGVPAESLEQISSVWLEEVHPLLQDPVPGSRHLQLDAAIAAGRAQLSLMERLLALPGLSENTRNHILANVSWRVPRLVEAAPAAEKE